MADVVARAGAEDVDQALCALLALRVQAIARAGLLAVSDEINGSLSGSKRQERQSREKRLSEHGGGCEVLMKA